jgi:cell pole-organizing protein PopZ
MADVRIEPSMEEILASIKRIIADDGLAATEARPQPRADSPASSPPEPLAEVHEPAAPPPFEITPEPAPPRLPPALAPSQPASHPKVAIAPSPSADAATLVSDDAASASRHALSALSSAVARAPGDNSVEGLVRELLRPMLREWLDARLPEIVETLVSREIARITGKAL